MTTTYCENTNLFIGDLPFSVENQDRFREIAFDEINAALGFAYAVPLSPTPTGHAALLLKNIESRLASGRLIMDRAASGEDTSLQAYGLSLVKEAQVMLGNIVSGVVDLIGYDKILAQVTSGNAPAIIQGDTSSGVDAYYDWLNRPKWWYGTGGWY